MPVDPSETPDRNLAGESRRAIEALAEALYEANNPDGVAWVKRPRIVRDPWLARAREQLQLADNPAPVVQLGDKPVPVEGSAAENPNTLRDV
jgi:hypothetical protein